MSKRIHLFGSLALALGLFAIMPQSLSAQDLFKVLQGQPVPEHQRKLEPVEVSPYWIGVVIADLTDTLKSQLQLDHGAVISSVMEDGPAASAGFRPHDIVLEFNGTKINSAKDLMAAVGKAEASESKAAILRKGKRETLKVTPAKRPPETALLDPTETEDLKSFFEKALRAQGGNQRFMIVRPPTLAGKAEFPKQLELHAVIRPDGQHKYEIKLDGKKYTVEGNDFSKLPPEVRKALPFLSGVGIAPRILLFSDDDQQLALKLLKERQRRMLQQSPGRVEVEIEKSGPKQDKGAQPSDDVATQLKELAKQVRELSKEVQALKEKNQ